MQEYITQMIDQIITSIPNILTALLILVASLYLAGLLGKLIRRALERRDISPGITNLLSQTLRWTIITFGMIAALQRFFNVTAFLAGLGILGFTVGFALQDIMQNFVAGIILLVQQPFKVGDAINVADYGGTVLVIDLRTTDIKTFDGRIIILPNADILSSAIENYTRANRRRVELPVGVAYDSDPETVRGLVLEAIQSIAGFVNEPAPMATFHTFGGSSIDLTAYFWIDTKLTNLFAAKDAALTKIKDAFEKAGVEIPYPIQTVLMHTEK
ncbi:MAG: mechanosensitive ion channel [Anaerolineales bacterium]|nr:mechanosensitive ion channel [Anaerolineales bacterium]